jgi:hypothetical protein
VADPAQPQDRAFESPRFPVERTLRPLLRAYDVYLLESRVVDGREWWRVADDAYLGCCAPFGWIPVTNREGEPLMVPSEVHCPSTSPRVTSYDLVHPGSFEPPACFGHGEIVMRGYLACTRGLIVDAPYFLSGLSSWDQTGVDCQLDARMTVYGEAVTSLVESSAADFEEFVDVTGHYYDPGSQHCRWTPGNFMQMPVDDAPLDTAEFACQMRFVATSVAVLP